MKRIISVICALALLALACIPCAMADSQKGTVKDGMVWELNDEGLLTISGNGAMPDYDSPEQTPWYAVKDKIVKVLFNGEITRVGSNAFANCSKLEHITFSDKTETIGKRAFYNCTALYSSDSTSEVKPIDDDTKMPGDVNNDKVVDGRDAIRLMKFIDEEEDVTEADINKDNADINKDGKIDTLDLLLLMKYLNGMLDTLEMPK